MTRTLRAELVAAGRGDRLVGRRRPAANTSRRPWAMTAVDVVKSSVTPSGTGRNSSRRTA